mmetsp:Transcript_12062/g.26864  ORF Transcript_12062/g.26864 Transcript_12062/m.26864 type:complete len:521 (+) Transcript_12062:4693-6255(+)
MRVLVHRDRAAGTRPDLLQTVLADPILVIGLHPADVQHRGGTVHHEIHCVHKPKVAVIAGLLDSDGALSGLHLLVEPEDPVLGGGCKRSGVPLGLGQHSVQQRAHRTNAGLRGVELECVARHPGPSCVGEGIGLDRHRVPPVGSEEATDGADSDNITADDGDCSLDLSIRAEQPCAVQPCSTIRHHNRPTVRLLRRVVAIGVRRRKHRLGEIQADLRPVQLGEQQPRPLGRVVNRRFDGETVGVPLIASLGSDGVRHAVHGADAVDVIAIHVCNSPLFDVHEIELITGGGGESGGWGDEGVGTRILDSRRVNLHIPGALLVVQQAMRIKPHRVPRRQPQVHKLANRSTLHGLVERQQDRPIGRRRHRSRLPELAHRVGHPGEQGGVLEIHRHGAAADVGVRAGEGGGAHVDLEGVWGIGGGAHGESALVKLGGAHDAGDVHTVAGGEPMGRAGDGARGLGADGRDGLGIPADFIGSNASRGVPGHKLEVLQRVGKWPVGPGPGVRRRPRGSHQVVLAPGG